MLSPEGFSLDLRPSRLENIELVLSSVMADVGCITVTTGFHLTSVNLGIELPHSKQCSKSSGFRVPQCEQYTGLRIEPQ